MIFNIVTPCTRTYNLSEILCSIIKATEALDVQVRWYIAFDETKVSPGQELKTLINWHRPWPDHIEINPLFVLNNKSVSGNAQRNEALSLITEGFIYFLDDDNIIHPEFVEFLLEAIEEHGPDIGILCPQFMENYSRIRNIDSFSVKVGGVDIAQFCIPANWVGQVRWSLGKYTADGIFLCTIYKAYAEKFVFAKRPLAYYNELQAREAALLVKNCGGLGGMLQAGDLVSVNEDYVNELSQPPVSKKQKQTITVLRRLAGTDLELLGVGDISNREYYVKAIPLDNRHPAYKNGQGLAVFFERPEDLHLSFDQHAVFGSEYEFPRKVNIGPQWASDKHRAGWGYAMSALRCLHTRQGVDIDGFVENNFSWTRTVALSQGLIPYHKPWIGFIHNPHNMPQWFGDGHSSNQQIFSQKDWQKSLKHCKGLFTLSKYHKKYVEEHTGVPVVALLHPTETPPEKAWFDPRSFSANKDKALIQVGWWLRRPYSLYKVKCKLKRAILDPGNPWQHLMKTSEASEKVDEKEVHKIAWQAAGAYDDLLSKNIVYLDLYDSSANNAIIECIVRNTPILVNRLEPVVEYLGENYPFYFENHQEAADKADNMQLIEETHAYLVDLPIKEKLTKRHFLKSFAESSIYQSL